MMSTATAANTRLFISKEEEKILVDKKSSKENMGYNVDPDADSTPKFDSELSLESQLFLKEQLGKEKDEASLKVNKEQLIGSVNVAIVEESKEAEVKVLNLIVQSPGRPDDIVATPFRPSTAQATLFTLKEGCKQQIKFELVVSNSTVSGLKYIAEVWKKGIKVDVTKKAVGKFSPREEPYKFELPEATTPSGFFARGSFAARTRFVDEDGKCHFDASYYFDIQKNWAS
ncbi:hypothetical protein V2J09_017943 [Rumex salicifolius]